MRLILKDYIETLKEETELETLVENILIMNDFTDIVVKYEQHKKGRTISGFSFDFKQKQERKKIDIKKSVLSDKQLDLFANKLAYDSAFSSQFSEPGESYDNFAKRIKEQLKDPVNLDKYLEYLDSLGLKL